MIKGFSVTQVLGASGVTLSPGNVWNDAGATFTGVRFNVTDTASAAASLLMDLQTDGTSRFRVEKSGRVVLPLISGNGINVGSPQLVFQPTSGLTVGFDIASSGSALLVKAGTSSRLVLRGNGIDMAADALGIRWTNGNGDPLTTIDTALNREGVGILGQRVGTNAQTKRIYGTYTDASNYRRVAIAMTTGGVASIAPEGAGTGASGNVLHISGLPTANPGPGILWNNGGTVEVGT